MKYGMSKASKFAEDCFRNPASHCIDQIRVQIVTATIRGVEICGASLANGSKPLYFVLLLCGPTSRRSRFSSRKFPIVSVRTFRGTDPCTVVSYLMSVGFSNSKCQKNLKNKKLLLLSVLGYFRRYSGVRSGHKVQRSGDCVELNVTFLAVVFVEVTLRSNWVDLSSPKLSGSRMCVSRLSLTVARILGVFNQIGT